MTGKRKAIALSVSSLLLGAAIMPAGWAQQTPAAVGDSAVSPPVNHESAPILEVLKAQEQGFRVRGYVVRWRDSRVYVSGSPDDPRAAGENLDFTVYRLNVEGHNILRFSANPSEANANDASTDAEQSRASITLGAAKIDEVMDAENGGYRFIAYKVMWHDMPVMIVDSGHPLRTVGERINFRVLHSGAADNKLLVFSAGD